ncbi:unnamed protein product [Diatraea saccharalis]|uniref:TIL domain-containing protein n=1 Tax=Diatraea saccharalis TaxID=40085 RepID=A0A9N9R0I8_9NEOP|nr:unnamed protein product [Diatraea saccharalis]
MLQFVIYNRRFSIKKVIQRLVVMLLVFILFGLMTHSLGSSSCGTDTQPPKCPITVECRPTCAKPIPDACLIAATPEPATSNVDGCQCLEGYILTDVNGKCVRIEECPRNQSCNGDPHAVIRSRPWACRPTCSQPNSMNNCSFTSMPVGCECESGYILNEDYGKCIKVEECPGKLNIITPRVFVICIYFCVTFPALNYFLYHQHMI